MPLKVIQDYLTVPYGDRIYVYTNIVTIKDIQNTPFHVSLSHERAVDRKSIAMAIHEAIKNHYGSLHGKKVLDVGSSIGHFSFLMAEEGADVTGIELLKKKVDVAKAIAKIKNIEVKFINLSIEEYLKKAQDVFDLILMHNVFEYIPQPEDLLRKLSVRSKNMYTTVLIEPSFVLANTKYTEYRMLLEKIYGPRDLWAFWN